MSFCGHTGVFMGPVTAQADGQKQSELGPVRGGAPLAIPGRCCTEASSKAGSGAVGGTPPARRFLAGNICNIFTKTSITAARHAVPGARHPQHHVSLRCPAPTKLGRVTTCACARCPAPATLVPCTHDDHHSTSRVPGTRDAVGLRCPAAYSTCWCSAPALPSVCGALHPRTSQHAQCSAPATPTVCGALHPRK